ncbi:DciA family protein [Actinobacillus porcinus]|uniref:DciA family protein n=1 Tax=Actinobacillus porcinus TaxID=51048 RepID=UPI002353DFCA|nr:DciA family protein [Actinobacillus porcinus]
MEKMRRYQKAMNIKDLLETSSLADVMKKGLLINEINQHIKKIFPVQFEGVYQIVNFDEKCLNIDVANAMVRQSFLFRQQELIQLIQQQYPSIETLQFRINPQLGKHK